MACRNPRKKQGMSACPPANITFVVYRHYRFMRHKAVCRPLAIHKDVHGASLPSAILISLGMLRMAGLRYLRQQSLAVQIRAKETVRHRRLHLCHLLREKLLHQAFLEVLEGIKLVRLQPDHLIKG